MATPSTIAAMAVVLLAVAAASVPGALGDANFIASTCKSSDNGHCVEVLNSDPRSINATTVHELASIGLDIADKNAAATYAAIRDKASHDDSDGRDALWACVRHYDDAGTDLVAAHKSFDEGSYNGAEEHTSLAEDAGDHCEQEFTDRHLTSTVTDLDTKMKDWTSVASDLIDLLWVTKRPRRLMRA